MHDWAAHAVLPIYISCHLGYHNMGLFFDNICVSKVLFTSASAEMPFCSCS